MKRLKKSQKGFSMMEMLVCTLILLLVGGICATGMGITVKGFQDSKFETESQMLESSLNLLFSDIFRYATDVEGISFTNADYDMKDGTIVVNSAGHFQIQGGTGGTTKMLVDEGVYGADLRISNFKLNYNGATGIFSGTYDIKSNARSELSRACDFSFRRIGFKEGGSGQTGP